MGVGYNGYKYDDFKVGKNPLLLYNDFDGPPTAPRIKPNQQEYFCLGIMDKIHLYRHNYAERGIIEERYVNLNGTVVDLCWSQEGDQIASISSDDSMRIFDKEFNFIRMYDFEVSPSRFCRTLPNHYGDGIGADLLVATDTGVINAYDTRALSKRPVISFQKQMAMIKDMHCMDWWNVISVSEDGSITLYDFRNKKDISYLGLRGLGNDLSFCPITRKTVSCTDHAVYVFASYRFHEGPIRTVKTDKGTAEKSVCVYDKKPGLFVVSFAGRTYHRFLDVEKEAWTGMISTAAFGIWDYDYFTGKSDSYVYYTNEDRFVIDDVNRWMNFNGTENVHFNKTTPKFLTGMDFSGLVDMEPSDDSMELNEDEDDSKQLSDDEEMAEDGNSDEEDDDEYEDVEEEEDQV